MPLTFRATHVLQWRKQREAIPRGGANPQKRSQFGLQAATRLHEAGIASNRGSVPSSREYQPSSRCGLSCGFGRWCDRRYVARIGAGLRHQVLQVGRQGG